MQAWPFLSPHPTCYRSHPGLRMCLASAPPPFIFASCSHPRSHALGLALGFGCSCLPQTTQPSWLLSGPSFTPGDLLNHPPPHLRISHTHPFVDWVLSAWLNLRCAQPSYHSLLSPQTSSYTSTILITICSQKAPDISSPSLSLEPPDLPCVSRLDVAKMPPAQCRSPSPPTEASLCSPSCPICLLTSRRCQYSLPSSPSPTHDFISQFQL